MAQYSCHLTLPTGFAPGRVDRIDPAAVELKGIEASIACEERADRLGEPVLAPPHCALAALASSGTARGALAAPVALSTLTVDSRRRWKLARQARLAQTAKLVLGLA